MQISGLLRIVAPVVFIGLTVVVAAANAGLPAGERRDDAPVVTIAYVNWTESVAVTHLLQALLENKFQYHVELRLVDVETAFQGVASGRFDAFLDVWLPDTHGRYWQEYSDKVVDLGVWYQGKATLGLAVPNYVEARTISDLKGRQEVFGGRIVGIQTGSGLMRVTREQAIPVYGLEGYRLDSGATEDLIQAVDDAIDDRAPIVFTAWKPHWLFSAYPIRYLDDPKNVYDQTDRIHAIVREGLKDDAPQAYALFDTFSLSVEQLGSLELTIANARSAWGGVRRWLADHQQVVAPWIAAASADRRDYFRSFAQ